MPTGVIGTVGPYNDPLAGLLKRVIGERVWMCDSADVPLINMLKLKQPGAGSMFQFSERSPYGTIEWIEWGREPLSALVTVNAAIPVTNGTDCYGKATYPLQTLTVGAAASRYFHRGMILEVSPNPASNTAIRGQLWVSSVDYAAGTITVIPGFNGTPVYAISTVVNPGLCILTKASPLCEVPQVTHTQGTRIRKNYWQKVQDWYSIQTYLDQMPHYGGMKGQLDMWRMRKIGGAVGSGPSSKKYTGELTLNLEKAFFYGTPSPGGTGMPSTLGGLESLGVRTVISPTFDLDVLNREMVISAEYGGIPTDLFISPFMRNRILNFYSSPARLEDGTLWDGSKVTIIPTNSGPLRLHTHLHLHQNEAWALRLDNIELLQSMPFTETKLPSTTDDCESYTVSGLFTMAAVCACQMFVIKWDTTCIDMSCFKSCFTPDELTQACIPNTPV